ncbi:hypothetical protein IO476_001040 [Campylobacter coli]|nr:hypothetical protein [Campylobacter coli]
MNSSQENKLDYLELGYKKQNSTCSIQEIRLPVFAPIKRFTPTSAIYKDFLKNKRTRSINTQWGNVTIKGSLLTQIHKDILDLIVLNNTKIQILKDQRISVDFSISTVLKSYGDAGFNYKWFKSILEDIMGAVVKIKLENSTEFYFHIISAMSYNEKGDFGGIILSKEYLDFYQKTIAINYNKEIQSIVLIENSLIKSIIRFFLSHNQINISLENLLIALGIEISSKDRYFRKVKQEIRENKDIFTNFKINFDISKNTFEYKGNDSVNFLFTN